MAGEGEELKEYRGKRRFDRTPEPPGGMGTGRGGIFVVQKHAASHLHYDFRLEMEGVLKSWAVPKGPSSDPSVKRLAMRVEDHPLEYASFEGIIPKGEYGGGTVMIWDSGLWQPEGDSAAGLHAGVLKFSLAGTKLHGRWMLVRGRSDETGRESWFLIKERDEFAGEGDLTLLDLSSATGRTMEEIARQREAVWTPEEGLAEGTLSAQGPVSGAVPSLLPEFVEPQLALLVKSPPKGDGWIHEIKHDGYRLLARLEEGDVRLITRRGNDWSGSFPTLSAELSHLPAKSALVDGEAVILREDGTSSFQELQNTVGTSKEEKVVYFAFDLLYLNGSDLTGLPLARRKELLELVISQGGSGRVRYSDHIEGKGEIFFENACRLGVEGIVSKCADAPYLPGRGGFWVKVKCINRREFVVGGFTEPGGGRQGFGALLVGEYDSNGRLVYCGRVGTGYDEKTLASLFVELSLRETTDNPFFDHPGGAEAKGVHWVRPELVAEIAFGHRTAEGILRHASFQGLRWDKNASDVVAEEPVELPSEEAGAALSPAGGRQTPSIHLSSPDKILYPERQITKRDLAVYYLFIAPRMLPHLAGRPLTLLRCPEGRDKECFFQKHANATVPPVVRRIPLEEDGEQAEYMTVNSVDALMGLVQMGILEIHTWGSRYKELETPDRLVFDLDPDVGLPQERLAEGALILRNRLLDLGLESFLKTTGGKGFHVVVPVTPQYGWEEVKAFCRETAEQLAREYPDRFTPRMGKEHRPNRIFLDWMRNIRGSTAIELYSTRARENAPLSVPLLWEELARGVTSGDFTMQNIGARLASLVRDPWEDFLKIRQPLPLQKAGSTHS